MKPLAPNAHVMEANCRPWKGAQDAVGDKLIAYTDNDAPVTVWRPHAGVPEQKRFWCHGHSTLSHHLYGYSIFSGFEMEIVLGDEWTHITKKPRAGDIIVFRNNSGTILHSARIEEAVHHMGASTEKKLSSKNGRSALKRGQTVEQILAAYKGLMWRVPDPGCCCGPCTPTVKQYYRRKAERVGIDTWFR